jgi:hypothetical protein
VRKLMSQHGTQLLVGPVAPWIGQQNQWPSSAYGGCC